jgi:geranylgeranyl diphosphate synthase type I
MVEKIAADYLLSYKKQSDPIFSKYLLNQKRKSKIFGKLIDNTIQQFNLIAFAGKRIRGALSLLGYEIAGGIPSAEVIKATLTMELFHAALLVHDDIMDKAQLRRGKKTIHTKLLSFFKGKEKLHDAESVAICIGDAAFYFALEILMGSKLNFTYISKAIKVQTYYAKRVALGQIQDILLSKMATSTQKQVLDMLYLKSGEYTCELPLMFGIELAGGINKNKKRALLNYAKSLGWLFQIQDDLLGIFGDEENTGKSTTSDISQGKMTLLRLFLNEQGDSTQIKLQNKLISKSHISIEERDQYRIALIESGVKEKVEKLAQDYLKNGIKQIPFITKNSSHQNLLKSLLKFMINRTK